MKEELSLQEKLHILADAAKYDVACTSSGADRKGKKGYLGNSVAAGICHSFAADGRCISLLKILLTNHCIYDCKYCINRASNDVRRATFTPREICELTTEFYKRNYIEGLFLSSGILKNPSYTMEQICETLHLLRKEYRFNGYIHVKAIPGAPKELLAAAGFLADRMSVNLELPTAESMKKLAPNKNHQAILRPMGMMTRAIAGYRLAAGKDAKSTFDISALPRLDASDAVQFHRMDPFRSFAPAGQSTQMIIGATPETDYHLMKTTQFLYRAYDLKRVFYSAYVPLNEDQDLPPLDTPAPLLREHRLYQADWLLRFYGFQAEELLTPERPNFNEQLDPKCDWALRHLELFPVEVNSVPFDMLLRIPGVGPTSARRIAAARKYEGLTFEHLKKMGVVLKRAHYFITCSGKRMYPIPLEEGYITRQLIGGNRQENWRIAHQNEKGFHQMSMFEDFGLT